MHCRFIITRSAILCGGVVCLLLSGRALSAEPTPKLHPLKGRQTTSISPAARDANGFLTHRVTSPQQTSETTIRVLPPDVVTPDVQYPVVYVLPVEANDGARYGDGLAEIKKHDLHNRCMAIFVAPSFSMLPWYADHPTNSRIQQESYFIDTVVPFIEQTYPAVAAPKGRLLLGFSKSGWGAWSLLLRRPDFFGRAAAWDAPLMMQNVGKYGNGPIFGTQETFANYRITDLLRKQAALLKSTKSTQPGRLILIDQGNFHEAHRQVRRLLLELEIPHEYHPGPQRRHDWRSGWVPIAAERLAPFKTADR